MSAVDYQTFSFDEAPRPLTDRERNLLHRMFSDWVEVPGEWKSALKKWLETDPPILGKSALGMFNVAGLPPGGAVGNPLIKSDPRDYYAAWDSRLAFPPSGAGGDIIFGGDSVVNLYRNGPGHLKTDATFDIGGGLNVTGNTNLTNLVVSGTTNLSGSTTINNPTFTGTVTGIAGLLPPGGVTGNPLVKTSGADYAAGWNSIVFSASGMTIAGDTNLYRVGGGQLKTDGQLYVGNRIWSGGVGTGGIWVDGGAQLVGSYDSTRIGMYFTSGGWQFLLDNSGRIWVSGNSETQLWRGSANTLQTNAHIQAGFHIYTGTGGYSVITTAYTYNRHNAGGVMAGVSDDVKLYRDTSVDYTGFRTDQDFILGKDLGVTGWSPLYVFFSNIGFRRVYVGSVTGSVPAGKRCLIID